MRQERRRREESRFGRLLRLLGIRRPPRAESRDAGDAPPDIGVREPRRPKPFGPAPGAAVLDPPHTDHD